MTMYLSCHFRQIQLIDTSINMHMRNSYFTKRHSTSAIISGIALSQLRLDFAMSCLSEVDLSNDNSVGLSF